MTDSDTTEAVSGSASYLAVNGYGVMVALLEIVIGVSGILDGPDGPIGWVYRVGIVVAGVGILTGLVTREVRVEVAAAGLLVAANLADWTNELLATYPPEIDWTSVAVQTCIIVGVTLRIRAVLQGGATWLPRWHVR